MLRISYCIIHTVLLNLRKDSATATLLMSLGTEKNLSLNSSSQAIISEVHIDLIVIELWYRSKAVASTVILFLFQKCPFMISHT